MGASNYPCNIGLNRRLNGGVPDKSWTLNGPNYVASNWDKTVSDTTTWPVSWTGPATRRSSASGSRDRPCQPADATNGLSEVYNLGENSDFFPTDYQIAQLCNSVPITNFNQQWQWKGEWWGYGATMIYSHTQMPNRTSCVYHDINQDGRGTITMTVGQFQPPGRRERAVHGRLGPFRQELGELSDMVCHRDSEQARSSQFWLVLKATA